MLKITRFAENHFDSKNISDAKLKEFAEFNIQGMSNNNPGGIYDTLVTDTTTFYTGYFGAMTDEQTKTSLKEGKTVTMNLKLDAFVEFVRRKEGLIRSQYGENSAEYQEFYPQGITQYNRMNLAEATILMTAYVNAATVHQADLGAAFATEATNLTTEFETAREDQQSLMMIVSGKKSVTASTRDELEIQLMKNVLTIALNNIGNPEAMKAYFDQSIITLKKHKTFSGIAGAGLTVNIDERTFSPNDEIVLRNEGSVALKFCIAKTAGESCNNDMEVQPNDETTVSASQLGVVSQGHFLNVTNESSTDGEYSVTIEL